MLIIPLSLQPVNETGLTSPVSSDDLQARVDKYSGKKYIIRRKLLQKLNICVKLQRYRPDRRFSSYGDTTLAEECPRIPSVTKRLWPQRPTSPDECANSQVKGTRSWKPGFRML